MRDAVDGNAFEIGEWTFSDDSSKAMFHSKRLQQYPRAQRRAGAEDVARMLGSFQPVHPAMNVVGFEHTVSDDASATLSMTTAVGREHCIMIVEQKSSKSCLAGPAVRDSVQ